jgi:hypothetical protein
MTKPRVSTVCPRIPDSNRLSLAHDRVGEEVSMSLEKAHILTLSSLLRMHVPKTGTLSRGTKASLRIASPAVACAC